MSKNLTVLIPGCVHRTDEFEGRTTKIVELLKGLTAHEFNSLTVNTVKEINAKTISEKSYCIEGKYDTSIIADYKDVRKELSNYLYSELDAIRKFGSGVYIAFENKTKEDK